MSRNDSQNRPIQGVEPQNNDVIKGSYQVVTPNPLPDPVGGNWGTASPSTPTPSAEAKNNNSSNTNTG